LAAKGAEKSARSRNARDFFFNSRHQSWNKFKSARTVRAQEELDICPRSIRTHMSRRRPIEPRKLEQHRLFDALGFEFEAFDLRAQRLDAGQAFHRLTRCA
jgi:hypothetical protein